MDIAVIVTGDPKDPDFDFGPIAAQHGGAKAVGGGKKGIIFENKHHPGFVILFNIDDRIGCDIRFLPNHDDALWVQRSSLDEPPCPTCPSYWDQFQAVDVIDNDENNPHERCKTLVVSNKNDYKQMFAFTLRFEIPGVHKVIEFDPIGNNQNGPQ